MAMNRYGYLDYKKIRSWRSSKLGASGNRKGL